ncbi:MAG TPA: beta-ketoacyl synthase chain length factor [Gammaproteobacteria bacterium]|nr:beta-ketoacyl synthase chain length factor [Gammaproteobacteria bacterium]
MVEVWLEGIGVWGPGMTGWPDCRARLAGEPGDGDYAPPPAAALSAQERRRSTATARLAAEVAAQACTAAHRAPADYATVFSCSAGDLANVDAICRTLARDPRLLSPTRFHNSVHNAPGGYWGIAGGCEQPSNSIAAGADSFAVGLLEAAVQCAVEAAPVMLVAYDLPGPVPWDIVCGIEAGFGIALALSAAAVTGAKRLTLRHGAAAAADVRLQDAALEKLRRGNPAARGLALLAALAAGNVHEVALAAGDNNLVIGISDDDGC